MRILVTGGCGFVGTHLSRAVMTGGRGDLIVVDNLFKEGSRANLETLRAAGKFAFFPADVRDADALDRIMADVRPDIVFHMAGQVAMTSSLRNPQADFDINAGGTLHLLEAMRRHRPACMFIYASTNKVYGDLDAVRIEETPTRYSAPDHPDGFAEDLPLDFRTPYGCSKGSADQYVLDYHRIFGMRTVVFRHSSMYGPHQNSTVDQGWVDWFCRMAAETKAGRLKEPFTISGNGKQVRDLLHADDVVALYFSAVAAMDAVAGQAFNIGGGMANSLSLLELFSLLEREMDVRLNFTRLPSRLSDQKVFVANLGKARRMLAWAPVVDMAAGLRRQLEWMRS